MIILKTLNIQTNILTLGDKYPSIRAVLFENPFREFNLNFLTNIDVWIISIAVSVIAILETLISGQIADIITRTKFDRRKEVFGLSIANFSSGFLGGIPATAALARTALNIKSGANHKISAVFNAFFIGAISLFFIEYFKFLPIFIIGSILVVVAINMVEKKHFIKLVDNERMAFYIALFVAALVIIEDPIVGLIVGSIIVLLFFVNKIAFGQTEILIWKDGKLQEAILKDEFVKKNEINSDVIVYKISGTLSYINMPAHLEMASKIKNNDYVIISMRHAFYVDIDGVEYLEHIIEELKKNNNKHIILTGINKEIEKKIQNEEFYKRKFAENKIYNRTSEALKDIMGR